MTKDGQQASYRVCGGWALPRTLLLAAVLAGSSAGGIGCGGGVLRWDAPSLVRVLRRDVGPPPGFALARYPGVANPACWSRDTAPVKPARRLRRLIAQGVSPQVRLCQVELLRRGTHDDILVKVFVLTSSAAARWALATPFVRERARRLTRHSLPAPRQVGNVMFYVIGSLSNKAAIRKVHAAVRSRLAGAVH